MDYPSDVKESGLNGFGKTESIPAAEVHIEPFYSAAPDIQDNETNYQTEPQEQTTEETAEVKITIGNDTYKGTLYKE